MNTLSTFIVTIACTGVLGSVVMFNPVEAQASDKHKYQRSYSHGGKHWGNVHKRPRVIHHGHTVVIPDKRVRRYHNTYIYRPYGRWYGGYGHYYIDDNAYPCSPLQRSP